MIEDFFRKAYEQESDRRHQFSTYLPLRVTFTVIVGGLLGNIVSSKQYCGSFFTVTGFLLAAAGAFSLLLAVYYIWKFHFGHSYNYLSYPDEIDDYVKKLKSYHGENLEQASKDISQHIEAEYIDCSAKNMRTNDQKSGYIYRLDVCLGIAALLAMFSFWSYVGEDVRLKLQNDEITKKENENGRHADTNTCTIANTCADRDPRAPKPTTAQSD